MGNGKLSFLARPSPKDHCLRWHGIVSIVQDGELHDWCLDTQSTGPELHGDTVQVSQILGHLPPFSAFSLSP